MIGTQYPHRNKALVLFAFVLFGSSCFENISKAQSAAKDGHSKISMGETAAEAEEVEIAEAQEKAKQIAAESEKEAAKNPSRTVKEILGPRKGRLREAGRFKTEMLARRSGIDVYLVNVEGQEPAVRGSSVEGNLYIDKDEYALKFWPNRRKQKFFAKWPKGVARTAKKISIVLLPTRKRVVGAPVVYNLNSLY